MFVAIFRLGNFHPNAERKLFFKNAVMSRLANAEMLLFANRSAESRMAGARKTAFLNGSNTIQKARGGRGGSDFG